MCVKIGGPWGTDTREGTWTNHPLVKLRPLGPGRKLSAGLGTRPSPGSCRFRSLIRADSESDEHGRPTGETKLQPDQTYLLACFG